MKNPPNNSNNAKVDPDALELEHCEPGDPCERVIEFKPDGTVSINKLCGEILPVAQALNPEPEGIRQK